MKAPPEERMKECEEWMKEWILLNRKLRLRKEAKSFSILFTSSDWLSYDEKLNNSYKRMEAFWQSKEGK